MMMVTPLASCGSSHAGQAYKLYLSNSSSDDIEQIVYTVSDYQTKDKYAKVSELLNQIFEIDHTDENAFSPKPENVLVNDYIIDKDGTLTIDFSREYLEMSNVREIILRASIVLTVIQVDGISGVRFTVVGDPIKYTNGQEIGVMTADAFVNLILSESGMLKQETDVTLYYANVEGTMLIPVTSHLVINSNNISIEEYILSQLIGGTEAYVSAGNTLTVPVFPTISPSVELINVVTTDRVCYVNFSESFLEQEQQPVSDEIMIYSIVNSLCRLTYVNSVQFLINGETAQSLHTLMDISKPFMRNRSLESE